MPAPRRPRRTRLLLATPIALACATASDATPHDSARGGAMARRATA